MAHGGSETVRPQQLVDIRRPVVYHAAVTMIISPTVRQFARHFSNAGHELFVVGGAVRDALNGQKSHDYDFATSATPEEVQQIFTRVIPTGIAHGTVTVLFRNSRFEVTTYRTESSYSDQRHPDSVTFTRSLEEDLSRRDLTINAIAMDPRSGRIIDPFGGREDLRRGIIRTVGDPVERFREDALRMLRAVRFSAVLEFERDPPVDEAIATLAPAIQTVSVERITQELRKMMEAARRPSRGWAMMRHTGLLQYVMPEIMESTGVPDLFEHLLLSADCAPPEQPVIRWAALLHDIGKPRCRAHDSRGLHFHGHDEESARMADGALRRLRFPNDMVDAVTHLVRHHMFAYDESYSDSAVRRLVAHVGREWMDALITLRRADHCGKTGRVPVVPLLDELTHRYRALMDGGAALTRADLAVNGRDLMETAGVPPGPLVGVVLEELLECVLDDPQLNNRERLLAIAEGIVTQRLQTPGDRPPRQTGGHDPDSAR